jgi:alpha-beta hydrolase superfamily lysophospholipase
MVSVFDTAQVRRSLRPISFSARERYTQPVAEYFRYYGLDFSGIGHLFGTFNSGQYTCAAHIYNQDGARGTVFLIHGYYDHAGILKNLIAVLLKQKFSVAAFDLPGHGLSTGEPASINSFNEYRTAFTDFLAFAAPNLPQPISVIGHSTGCAVILDGLFSGKAGPFRDVILLAPLVRSVLWHLSIAAFTVAGRLLPTLPRLLRRESADTAFLSWFARDPLQIRHFPVRWLPAFLAWERTIRSVPPQPFPVTIIQGTRDKTVDWRYNVPFLQKKIPGCSVVFIKGARHQLFNEAEPLRNQTLESVRRILDG